MAYPQLDSNKPSRRRGRIRVRWQHVLIATFLAGAYLWNTAPSTSDFQSRVNTLVVSRGDAVLAPGDIPPILADAIVATEDERYFSHHGLDVIGLLRASQYDLLHHCLCEGGSTITQQLVKDLYLSGSDRGWDKLTDMVLAIKVETEQGKRVILADYLSEILVGENQYGVASGACTYFGIGLGQLDLAQYAMLAGLPQAPNFYDPFVNPGQARLRRHQVLESMLSEGDITPSRLAGADSESLPTRAHASHC
ncbi:MAG TPA: biosynthetic peptidoglycan transglycosylase [Candidatus Dormibacteraeota bacterium]|nr:biosynthetic peptidoglycan transglycosylase [Candidatus Dormibacteraeota bacterium]